MSYINLMLQVVVARKKIVKQRWQGWYVKRKGEENWMKNMGHKQKSCSIHGGKIVKNFCLNCVMQPNSKIFPFGKTLIYQIKKFPLDTIELVKVSHKRILNNIRFSFPKPTFKIVLHASLNHKTFCGNYSVCNLIPCLNDWT